MEVSVDPVTDAVYKVLGDFLVSFLPDGFPVMQSQQNRIAPPSEANYVTMNITYDGRLATNVVTQSADVNVQTASILQSTDMVVQLQFFGDLCGNYSNVASTLLRDNFACEFFADNATGIMPLYPESTKQVPFSDGQQQIESRWIIDMHIEVDLTVVIPQQSATEAVIVAVDVTALPTP